MGKEPIIETERLILRPLVLDDAESCFAWTSDERVTKFIAYSTHTDIKQTRAWIESVLADKETFTWGFLLKSENKLIGSGSIGPSSHAPGYWSIGYNLNYAYWHKGYCTEAMRAIIDFACKELGVKKICASHTIENSRSGKVMEKCGLKFDHYGEVKKLDGSKTFQAKFYSVELE